MYASLLTVHSVLRWVLLLGMLAMIIRSILAKSSGSAFSALDNRGRLIVLISAHTQLLLGLWLYMISPFAQTGRSNMAEAMRDSVIRFWTIEHLFGMVVAIALITVGHVLSKKASNDADRFKAIFIWYLISLAIMLATIPWPFREMGLGRGWI